MMLCLVAAAPAGCDAREFFDALHADGVLAAHDVEIRVVQDSSRPILEIPAGVVLETVKHKASIFELWGEGVRHASAPYIAIVDARCPIEKGWLEGMRVQLKTHPSALFGPVSCGWPSTSANAVGYLVEYVQFHQPLSPLLRETPGINLVAARACAQHPDVLQHDGFVKTRLLAHFDAIGVAPLPVPESVVRYRKAFRFGEYCAHRYRHGRCYAADRAHKRGEWPFMRAFLAAPILPFVRTLRICRAAGRARQLPLFWRWSHRTLAAETAWSVGEFVGYMFGAGTSRAHLR